MPDIMIRCPTVSRAVSTGLNTETVVFASLIDLYMPLQCPACGQVHKWRPPDAWVYGTGRLQKRRPTEDSS
jgi:hypothetical protein